MEICLDQPLRIRKATGGVKVVNIVTTKAWDIAQTRDELGVFGTRLGVSDVKTKQKLMTSRKQTNKQTYIHTYKKPQSFNTQPLSVK